MVHETGTNAFLLRCENKKQAKNIAKDNKYI